MYSILKIFRQHVTVKIVMLLLSHIIIYKIGTIGAMHSCTQVGPVHSRFLKDINVWEAEELPIMKSQSRGFHPIYVYSKKRNISLSGKYSQAQQDRMIIALMRANDERTGTSKSLSNRKRFFVDLAAYEARKFSNTYRLEQNDWEGLCIEPNLAHWYDLAAHRTCTIIAAFVGGAESEDGKVVDVKLSGESGMEGIVGKNFDNKGNPSAKRNLVSISTIFKEAKVPSIIDYFSLDVEGAESLVMRNFPWDLYKIKFMTIERPKNDLQAKLNENGYKKLGTISSWGETIWCHESLVSVPVNEARKIIDKLHCRC